MLETRARLFTVADDAGQDGSWRALARLRKPVRLWTASGSTTMRIPLAAALTATRVSHNPAGSPECGLATAFYHGPTQTGKGSSCCARFAKGRCVALGKIGTDHNATAAMRAPEPSRTKPPGRIGDVSLKTRLSNACGCSLKAIRFARLNG